MEKEVPLKEVIQVTLNSSVETTETVQLSKAIEMVLKSNHPEKTSIVSEMISLNQPPGTDAP